MIRLNVGVLAKEADMFQKAADDLRALAKALGRPKALGNAARLVALLAEEGPMRMTDITKELKVNKVTLYDWERKNPGVFTRQGRLWALRPQGQRHH